MDTLPASPPPFPPINPYASPTTDPIPPPPITHPIVEAVMAGHRYITIPYVFSVVVMSFRRSMGGVHTVRTGEWPMGALIGASCITLFVGWWGIPWGFIWSALTLVSLWRGGKDVTKEVLTNVIGAAEAKRILAVAPKPKPPGSIWLVRAMVLVPVILVGFVVVGIMLAPGSP